MPDNIPFSAQVVLNGSACNTAGQPERAQRAFLAHGFATGPYVGNSFSITAPAAEFQALFCVALAARADGGVAVNGAPCRDGLPLQHLPDSLRALLSAVVFSEPPAFGPGAP